MQLIIFGVIVFLVLAQFIDGRIAFAIGLVLVVVVRYVRHRRIISKIVKDIGLTPEEVSSVTEDLRQGDREAVVQRIATA